MEPTIKIGDLIVIDLDDRGYIIGDIVTYYDEFHTFVTHRIVDVREGKFITKGDFNSNSLSSQCKEFKLQGVLSYNNSKSSISISNVEYCGTKNDINYDFITCTLYESNNSNKKIVSTCDKKDNISLEEYLKELSFNITNYEQSCKRYESGVLRLEIIATENNNEEKFVVPLSLDEKC